MNITRMYQNENHLLDTFIFFFEVRLDSVHTLLPPVTYVTLELTKGQDTRWAFTHFTYFINTLQIVDPS